MAEEQPTENQYKKYEDITDVMLVEAPERVQTLEDRLTLAWADHVKANPEDHGKGMGDALYDAASKYIKEDMYGIKGPVGNANLEAEIDGKVKQIIVFSRANLVDALKDMKVVHSSNIKNLMEKSGKSLIKALQGIQAIRLGNLGDEDFEPFRDYVLALGQEIGVDKLTKEQMPTLHAAIQKYSQIMPLVENYRGIRKAAGTYNPKEEE